MSAHGTYETVDGNPAVRFERRLAYPVEAVWRTITEPAELAHWFPCAVEVELRVGGDMRFIFSPDFALAGEVLELEPPHRFTFLWGKDTLRFELMPHADGTLLTMVHVLDEEGAPAAAKTAAGHLCLDAMERRLAGSRSGDAPSGPSPEWLARYDEYRAAGVPSGADVPGLEGVR